MEKQIRAYHNEANNCIDDSIVSICEMHNIKSEYMYINSLKFDYNKTEKFIGRRILIKDEIDYDVVEKFCNMKIVTHKESNFEDLIKKISFELNEKNPCMIHVRCKDFIWDNFYNKKNVPDSFIHKVLVVKIKKDYLLCTDGFYGKTNEKLSYNDYKKALVNEINVFKIVLNKERKKFDYQYELKKVMKKKSEIGSNIREFARDIKNDKVIYEEVFMDSNKYPYSSLSDNLRIIYRCRKKFKILLEDYYKTSGNIIYKNCIDKINESIEKWNYVMILFTKINLKKEYKDFDKIYDFLMDIADIEERIVNELLNI